MANCVHSVGHCQCVQPMIRLSSLCLVSLMVIGCGSARLGMAPNAEVDATAELKAEIAAIHKEFTARDLTVGGGTDSISLGLAILGLAVQPVTVILGALAYQYILRPRRMERELIRRRCSGH